LDIITRYLGAPDLLQSLVSLHISQTSEFLYENTFYCPFADHVFVCQFIRGLVAPLLAQPELLDPLLGVSRQKA
jgi:hypothetical protein